jgi:hypothetical protein
VLGRFSINLSYPILNDIDKTMNKNIIGRLNYKSLKLNFNFMEAVDEIELKVKFPLRIKIQGYSFLNKYPSETNALIIEVIKINIIFIEFNAIRKRIEF